MLDLIIGFVLGVAACLLVQRFLPAKWSKFTDEANEELDKQLKK
jgi:membrane-associated phospholipid phosphatase